jgi:DNA processing protein
MIDHTALIWSWLHILNKKRYDALMQVYGDLDQALSNLDSKLLKGLGCKEETIYAALNRYEECDPKVYKDELDRRGLELISIEDTTYPKRLKEIGDPPIFLLTKGDISVLDQPCIGLVGTRKMSAYGKRVVGYFVPPLINAGCVTISGLALGIDTEVAKETILASGKTVAVLGYGPARILPSSNASLAKNVISSGGLILSEFPLDYAPDKHTFPARNRIIAGLSLATVVLEAPCKSGALITADLALEYNRDVFAIPGHIFDPNFVGCNEIIAKGQARLVNHPDDILKEIGIITPQTKKKVEYQAKNDVESKILEILTTLPIPSDIIVERSGVNAGQINAALTIMELEGLIMNTGGMWVRK